MYDEIICISCINCATFLTLDEMEIGAYWLMILLRNVSKTGGGGAAWASQIFIELIIIPALCSLIIPLNLRSQRFGIICFELFSV
jgi:hypothetical protein